MRPEPSDSLTHTYFHCPSTNKFIEIFHAFTGYPVSENNYFIGITDENLSKERALYINLDYLLLKYFIHKLRNNNTEGKTPPAIAVLYFIKEKKQTLTRVSRKYRHIHEKMMDKYPYQNLLNSNFRM